MKKLFLSILTALGIFTLGNFGLWFWHSRLIISAIDNFQSELALNNITLSYGEIRFTNFLSWDTKASINDIKLVHTGYKAKSTITTDSIRLTSTPLDNALVLEILSDVNIDQTGGRKDGTEILKFSEPAILKLDLHDSIRSLAKGSAYNKQRSYDIFNKLQLDIKKWEALSKSSENNEEDSHHGDGIFLDIRNHKQKRELSYDVVLDIKNVTVGPVIAEPATDTLLSFALNFNSTFRASADREKILEDKYGKSADFTKVENAFNTSEFKISKCVLNVDGADLISLHGDMSFIGPQQQNINLKFELAKYKTFIQDMITHFNSVAVAITAWNLKPISPSKQAELFNILSQFAKDDMLVLDILISNTSATISGQPAIELLMRVYNIIAPPSSDPSQMQTTPKSR